MDILDQLPEESRLPVISKHLYPLTNQLDQSAC